MSTSAPEHWEEKKALLADMFRYAQVGQCVSSVTHDVNNLLGAIMAYSELIGLDLKDASGETRRMLSEIIDAVRKASGLVNNITDISRRERRDVRIVDPVQLMERALDLRRYDLKVLNAAIETDYGTQVAPIAVDLPKLIRAFMYVLSNAIEVLEDAGTKRVRVSVTETGEDAVDFAVWNSGPPLDAELAEQAFAPFFTTKLPSDHLGLGLTIARETARLHEGDLFYDSSRGFVFRLPRRNSLA